MRLATQGKRQEAGGTPAEDRVFGAGCACRFVRLRVGADGRGHALRPGRRTVWRAGTGAPLEATREAPPAKVAIGAGGVYVLIQVFDIVYKAVVSPGDESDGIVPVKSQTYPRANRIYHVYNADSHVGTTRSDYVRLQIRAALKEAGFNIQTR